MVFTLEGQAFSLPRLQYRSFSYFGLLHFVVCKFAKVYALCGTAHIVLPFFSAASTLP